MAQVIYTALTHHNLTKKVNILWYYLSQDLN